MERNRTWILLGAGLSTGLAVVALVFALRTFGSPTTVEQVAEAFFRANYRHDFGAAWDLVSSADQAAREKSEYLSTNSPPGPGAAELYRALDELGTFEVVAIASSSPDQAILTAEVRFPNTGQTEVASLLESDSQASAPPSDLRRQIEQLAASGGLGYFEGDVSFNLVLEGNRWRVVQHWGTAVTIRLEAAVATDLPWEFYPVQAEVLAQPGELAAASYVAINRSDRTITAKAVHEVGPAEVARYFQTIQCFCFTEQTLGPGEQREMQMLFRIDFSLPAGLELFHNRYTFYTLEGFPAGG